MGGGDGGGVERYARDDAVMAAYGIEVREVGPGRAVVAMAVGPQHCDHRGRLAPGAAFTLADAAIALASNSYGPVALLVHADAEWLASPAVGDALTATCRVVHHDATSAALEASVHDAGGRVVAVVRGSTRTPRR